MTTKHLPWVMHGHLVNIGDSDWHWLVEHSRSEYKTASGVIRALIEVYKDAIELEAQGKCPTDLHALLERVERTQR